VEAGGFEWGPETAAGGAVIVMDGKSGDIVLVAADPAAYRELGRIRPMEKGTAWNSPVVADGKMLVRTRRCSTASMWRRKRDLRRGEAFVVPNSARRRRLPPKP